MKTQLTLGVCLVTCLAASVASAEPYVEKAQAKTVPWSGYWWPLHQDGLVRPLGKYDAATGHKAVAWEKAHRAMGSSAAKWTGFCHAWAASAIMEAEPKQIRVHRGANGQQHRLGVGDQKGVLAACHTNDVANCYGDRYESGESDKARLDIAPDALWRLLKLYLGKQQAPLVMDIDAGTEVWNFPVYAYEIRTDGMGDGPHKAVLSLWMVDDGVEPNFVGSRVRRLSYTFSFTMRSGAVVMGSGRWTGRSEKDHPDFAWYPYLAKADNPQVIQAAAREILGRPTTTPSVTPPAETPEPAPQPTPQPNPPANPPATPEVSPQETLPGPNNAQERPVLTPVELAALVANRTSAFSLDVTVDRFDGATYQAGEPISLRVNSNEAGYLYLFYLDNHGKLSVLYPPPNHPGRIDADTPTNVPGANDSFRFVAGASPGLHRIKAVVTTRPITLGGLVCPQQPAQGDKDRPVQQQTKSGTVEQVFRWPAAQQEQVQAILQPYASQNVQQTVDGADPRESVGRFAQDEVVFLVEPAGKPGGPAQLQQSRPSQEVEQH